MLNVFIEQSLGSVSVDLHFDADPSQLQIIPPPVYRQNDMLLPIDAVFLIGIPTLLVARRRRDRQS